MLTNEEYWAKEGLSSLFEHPYSTEPDDVFRATSNESLVPFAPVLDDLANLHRSIRRRMSTTVLEFGVGYSTLVIADALQKNAEDFDRIRDKPKLRVTKPFHCYSVDASGYWIDETKKKLDQNQLVKDRATISYSRCVIGTFREQICHYYETLPDVVPDFIYLDGPSPKDVEGTLRGMSFRIDERTVMAADILTMESTLLPGVTILVDGRVNNVRFLTKNLTRSWVTLETENDQTLLFLEERPLGKHSHDLAMLRGWIG